jgi:hypothetical protein
MGVEWNGLERRAGSTRGLSSISMQRLHGDFSAWRDRGLGPSADLLGLLADGENLMGPKAIDGPLWSKPHLSSSTRPPTTISLP